ncbi:penicillin-binding protein activator [Aquicella lusitana]|uniref:LppC lipoprotein n=1 Tax=Aquicella lusitana TaxID=254246 RepID=A0A370GS51_9COXI|nr:penicillin-binding protein activator [Aquicella lusitana]RDI44763.1 hypothetical protein C8D86_10814 [Aquicella lusitana]VVC72960.1 Penicillin-binding protein activator LpoA [Aquicella lusitana]
MQRSIFIKIILGLIIAVGLASCSTTTFSPASTSSSALSPESYHTTLWEGNADTIWNKLQATPPSRLAALQRETSDPTQNAWLQLALISKRNSVNTQQLAHQLIIWRNSNPSHPANQLLPNDEILNQLQNAAAPQQIALLLPQSGPFGTSGRAVREGFLNAYYANLSKAGQQRVKFYDTASTPSMAALHQQAVAEGADFVIGPLIKDQVQQLSKSGSFTSPTLALNYTTLYWGSLPTNFYEFGLLPEDEVAQIADRAHETGRSRAIIIAPQNVWGKRLVSAFSTRWQSIGGSIQETWYYSANTDFNQEIARLLKVNLSQDKQLMKEGGNKESLQNQRRQDFDVIFLFAQPQPARAILPLLRYYYAGDVPVYATSSIYSGKLNPAKDADLNGVIICDIPWTKQLARMRSDDEVSSDRLYAVGQDAYLLSQTLQRLTYLPNFPIYGRTGALTLSSTHQIHRRLPCTVIRNERA